MNEILQLLRENNQMLKFICNYITSQDSKNFTMNLLADILTDGINDRK